MIFDNTVQQEGTIIYGGVGWGGGGGENDALCVRVCRKGGGGN